MQFVCLECGKRYSSESEYWVCECGGIFKAEIYSENRPANPAQKPQSFGLWKYWLPVKKHITLGEGWTPLIRVNLMGVDVHLKLDFLFSTGSFKDRGAAILINKLLEMGIKEVVEDSSGNGGASIAAYCAAAGIDCTIIVPATTSSNKIKQIEAYGARIIRADGGRPGASRLAHEMADKMYYASHIYNPFFYEGTRTLAFEIWEQTGRKAPDFLVVPVGSGTMFLGVYYGFKQLLESGLIESMPRLVGVQEEGCTPVADNELFEGKIRSKEGICKDKQLSGKIVSEGISIPHPPRLKEILLALEDTKGWVEVVTGLQVLRAQKTLANKGIFVEPTAATVVAAFNNLIQKGRVKGDENWVLPLTGTGLKKTL